jgi:hypothetical protein
MQRSWISIRLYIFNNLFALATKWLLKTAGLLNYLLDENNSHTILTSPLQSGKSAIEKNIVNETAVTIFLFDPFNNTLECWLSGIGP